jgi:hypothetical protein
MNKETVKVGDWVATVGLAPDKSDCGVVSFIDGNVARVYWTCTSIRADRVLTDEDIGDLDLTQETTYSVVSGDAAEKLMARVFYEASLPTVASAASNVARRIVAKVASYMGVKK